MPALEDMSPAYREASIRTAGSLQTAATQLQLQELSHLSLPEIERLSDEIARDGGPGRCVPILPLPPEGLECRQY